MAVNEVVKNSAYRVWSELENVWKKYALWTTARQVECTDGQSVEDKIGSIKGITTSTNVTEEGYIADAKTVSELSKRIGTVEQSFPDGCSKIAAAITEMGVATASNASPDTMAANIKKINTEPVKVASGNGNATYTITNVDGYKKLTASDFMLVATGIYDQFDYYENNEGNPGVGTLTKTPTIGYNSSSGTITVSGAAWSVMHSKPDNADGGTYGWVRAEGSISYDIYVK